MYAAARKGISLTLKRSRGVHCNSKTTMDFNRMLALCIFASVGLLSVNAMDACVQELAMEYSQCVTSMMPLLTSLGSSISQPQADPNDPMGGAGAVLEVICSPEGLSAMNCMLGVMKRCPAIMNAQAGAGGAGGAGGAVIPGVDFNTIMNEGGMDTACEILKGPCKGIMPCIQAASLKLTAPPVNLGNDDMGVKGSYSSPYSVIPHGIANICGPQRELVLCVTEHDKECPHTSAKFMDQARESAAASPNGLSYDLVLTFIKDQCSSMPTAMKNDQSCVSSALASAEFVECFTNMTVKHNIDPESQTKLSCGAYTDSKMCLEKNVEPTCGKESADFLNSASVLFIPGMPSKQTCEGTTGGAVFLQASATLVMIASIFVFGRL